MENTNKKYININTTIVLSEMIVEVKPPSSTIRLEPFAQVDDLVEETETQPEVNSVKELVNEEVVLESDLFLEKEKAIEEEKLKQENILESAGQYFLRKQQVILQQQNNIRNRMRSMFF